MRSFYINFEEFIDPFELSDLLNRAIDETVMVQDSNTGKREASKEWLIESIVCDTRLCKMVKMDRERYKLITELTCLQTDELKSLIMSLNEPMPSHTDKAKRNFLKYFKVQFVKRGKILALEGHNFEHPFFLIHGKAMSYKKLLNQESKHDEKRKRELASIKQGQSLKHDSHATSIYANELEIISKMDDKERSRHLG